MQMKVCDPKGWSVSFVQENTKYIYFNKKNLTKVFNSNSSPVSQIIGGSLSVCSRPA